MWNEIKKKKIKTFYLLPLDIFIMLKMGEVYCIPWSGKPGMKLEASRNMADLAC